jgi:hypothetical protein
MGFASARVPGYRRYRARGLSLLWHQVQVKSGRSGRASLNNDAYFTLAIIMKRKDILPSEAPQGFVLGSTIDVSSLHGHAIFVDLSGHLHCILGYRRENQPPDLPFYHSSVAARDNNGRTSYRFVELRRGALARSGFLRDDQYYRHK